MANNRRSNRLVVPGVESAIQNMKNEIAAELGYADYDSIDKGALPARVHGMIGGSMTKRLIELGQQSLAQGASPTQGSNLDFQEYRQHAQDDLNQTH